MKIYIYRYRNKITGNSYIGKTNNLERRHREHKSMANNIDSTHYNSMWARKIRQYGIENFELTVLEETTEEFWEEREKYWIGYYNTFNGEGYNSNEGGEGRNNYSRALSDEEALEVIELLKENKLTQENIAKMFEISNTLLSNINIGLRYKQENETYPIRKNYKEKEDYEELIDLLLNSRLSFKKIAEKLGMAESTVKKINYGTLVPGLSKNYPIRKENRWVTDANIVKDLLQNSDLTFTEIAKKVGITNDSVSRINRGRSHHDPNINYPVRKKP